MNTPERVRVTITGGMGRVRVLEEALDPTACTASVLASDMISSIVLDSDDTINVIFLYAPLVELDDAG